MIDDLCVIDTVAHGYNTWPANQVDGAAPPQPKSIALVTEGHPWHLQVWNSQSISTPIMCGA